MKVWDSEVILIFENAGKKINQKLLLDSQKDFYFHARFT